VTALFGLRDEIQPVSFGPTIFNDRGTRSLDSRNFIEAAYTHNFGPAQRLLWRVFYDGYRYEGIYRYSFEPGTDIVEDNRDSFRGDWVGSQLTYRFGVPHFGTFTVGASAQFDLRALMQNYDVEPTYQQFLSTDHRDKQFAVFAQDEYLLTPKWNLNLGVRFDYSVYQRNSISPRGALIYQPSAKISYKFLYGRAFTNPSPFELFYTNGFSNLGNPSATAEKAQTFEFDVERKLTRKLNAQVSAYHWGLGNLLVAAYTPSGLLQYQNAADIHASGVELEINGHPMPWLEFVTSWGVQRAVYSTPNYPLANSPGQIGKLHFSVPVFTNRFSFASGMQYMGSRQTDGGATLPPLFLADITIASKRLPGNTQVQAGVCATSVARSTPTPSRLTPDTTRCHNPEDPYFSRSLGGSRTDGSIHRLPDKSAVLYTAWCRRYRRPAFHLSGFENPAG
jgi:outer membrane receptor for ferrienterochelin and colicins